MQPWKIGLRVSPHLEAVCQGIKACGENFTSTYDTGCDFWLCWGWPQAEQVVRDGGVPERIICVDAHPFALAHGDRTGARILQLGNWGYKAAYPIAREFKHVKVPKSKAVAGGPVLVLGHVASTEQIRQGLVDVWYTPGGDAWLADELQQKTPPRRFRPHPRMWNRDEQQPTLAQDLKGCSRAIAWNSTSAIHARLLGYPATTVEPHGWGSFGDLDYLGSLAVTPAALRSGEYWRTIYRPWLEEVRRQLHARSQLAKS
jgi:hypothetical protein